MVAISSCLTTEKEEENQLSNHHEHVELTPYAKRCPKMLAGWLHCTGPNKSQVSNMTNDTGRAGLRIIISLLEKNSACILEA